MVVCLGPARPRDREAFADLDRLDRRDAEHRLADQPIELVERRFTQTDRRIDRVDLDDAAKAVMLFLHLQDRINHLFGGYRVRAADDVLLDLVAVKRLHRDPADLAHEAEDLASVMAKDLACDRAGRNATPRLPRR